jgi:membrane associated rhomboid family serine protease
VNSRLTGDFGVTPWVQRLIILNVILFFIEQTAPGFTNYLVLVPRYVYREPWTLVTYMFLHDPRQLTHILFNMLGLWMFGSRVEERIGGQRFLALYLISGLAGALLSMVLAPNAAVVGASGAVFGIMLAFARFWPDAQILFFFFPVQARIAVILMAVLELYSGFGGSRSGIANFCHLGGFAGAWLYLTYLERRAGTTRFRSKTVAPVGQKELANWREVNPARVHAVNRDEVNRILDKISAHGVASLTPQEKLFLSNFVPPDDRVPPVS